MNVLKELQNSLLEEQVWAAVARTAPVMKRGGAPQC